MKTEKNILIAFILNFAFSIFEFDGGIFTGSVAIISDAIQDIGDATSIGLALFFLISDVIFQTKSFTGNPDKDAQIMNERVMEDGEDPNEVMNELINFYIEEGYGMQRAKDALNRVGNY